MLTNYLKIAIRTLIRNRGTSLINIIGLAIGLASCILIFLYVRFELSFDKILGILKSVEIHLLRSYDTECHFNEKDLYVPDSYLV